LLAVWVKQARGSSAIIGGTLLREKALHIATKLGTEDVKVSKGWIDGFKQQQLHIKLYWESAKVWTFQQWENGESNSYCT
jgi:hypothetical protein